MTDNAILFLQKGSFSEILNVPEATHRTGQTALTNKLLPRETNALPHRSLQALACNGSPWHALACRGMPWHAMDTPLLLVRGICFQQQRCQCCFFKSQYSEILIRIPRRSMKQVQEINSRDHKTNPWSAILRFGIDDA